FLAKTSGRAGLREKSDDSLGAATPAPPFQSTGGLGADPGPWRGAAYRRASSRFLRDPTGYRSQIAPSHGDFGIVRREHGALRLLVGLFLERMIRADRLGPR